MTWLSLKIRPSSLKRRAQSEVPRKRRQIKKVKARTNRMKRKRRKEKR